MGTFYVLCYVAVIAGLLPPETGPMFPSLINKGSQSQIKYTECKLLSHKETPEHEGITVLTHPNYNHTIKWTNFILL